MLQLSSLPTESPSRCAGRRANCLLDLHTAPLLEPIAPLSSSHDEHKLLCPLSCAPHTTPTQLPRRPNSNPRVKIWAWLLWTPLGMTLIHILTPSMPSIKVLKLASSLHCQLFTRNPCKFSIRLWTFPKYSRGTSVYDVGSLRPKRLVNLAWFVCAMAKLLFRWWLLLLSRSFFAWSQRCLRRRPKSKGPSSLFLSVSTSNFQHP